MSRQSSVSDALFLLENVSDFQEQALKLVQSAQRQLAILSTNLDPLVYDTEEFVSAASQFARSSRYAQITVLVKNTQSLIDRGHRLARLSQRLSSKVQLRKLTLQPENTDMAFMLCDSNMLLYKNDDQIFQGFVNYAAEVEVKRLRETFDYVWQHAIPEVNLQQLSL